MDRVVARPEVRIGALPLPHSGRRRYNQCPRMPNRVLANNWQYIVPLAGVAVLIGRLALNLGKKAAEELGKAVGKGIGEALYRWLGTTIAVRLNTYERRYRDHIYYATRDSDIKGITHADPFAVTLGDIYV